MMLTSSEASLILANQFGDGSVDAFVTKITIPLRRSAVRRLPTNQPDCATTGSKRQHGIC
ncbi:MAG: hypothetical protein ACLUOF_03480 [Ruminococcus sp.]